MTSPRLAQIARQLQLDRAKKPTEKAPADGLAGVIEEMIARQVEERVSEALDRHRERLQPTSPRLRQLLRQDSSPPPATELPPTPKAAPPKDLTALIHRNAEGRAVWLEVGDLKFDVQRNALGRVTGMRQRQESPVLPQPPIPELKQARQYREPPQ